MSQPSNPHPHWWEEIRQSGKLNIGAHIVHEGYDDYSTQHYALWQAAAFRLPLVQQEASSWWDAPPTLQGLHPQDFLAPASDPQNFQIIWQEKTLVVARALQACAEASRAKWGVLCRAIRELQQCMAPLMTINGDDVMEASLLRPVEEESGPVPTLQEEAAPSWAREMGPQEPQALLLLQAEISQFHRTSQAGYHSSHFHCTHCCPSLKREVLGRDWCQSQQHWSVGPSLLEKG